MLTPLLAMPGGMEWIVILVIVVIIFGAAKLPDLARSSGQALRIFKSETRALRDEETVDELPSGEDELPTEQTPVDKRHDETA